MKNEVSDEDIWAAEIFTDQAKEWMRACPNKVCCPYAKLFTYLIILKQKNEEQEHRIKQLEEFPRDR